MGHVSFNFLVGPTLSSESSKCTRSGAFSSKPISEHVLPTLLPQREPSSERARLSTTTKLCQFVTPHEASKWPHLMGPFGAHQLKSCRIETCMFSQGPTRWCA